MSYPSDRGLARGFLIGIPVVLGVIAGIIFPANFYTVERKWVGGVRLGDPVHTRPPLRAALGQCVAANDREALAALERTGSYKTSGWFLNEDRWSAVVRCMSDKGWLLVPVNLSAP